jgi:hypothetical protein
MITLGLFMREACTGFQKVLGLDHPTTRSCLKQYASMRLATTGLNSNHNANSLH